MAFLVQTWAQSIMDPSRVAIILTTEVIFASVIAVAVGQETLALRTILGGGLMVVAKTRSAMDALVAAIAARQVRREYLALAHKRWQGPQTVQVDQPLGRDPRLRTRMAVVDLQRHSGKTARTDVRLLGNSDSACWVHCQLQTGRTHQIRVHKQHLGHPLLADELYGGRPMAGLQRQALHAWRLSLQHPVSGQAWTWQRTPPPDMAAALAELRLGPQTPDDAELQ